MLMSWEFLAYKDVSSPSNLYIKLFNEIPRGIKLEESHCLIFKIVISLPLFLYYNIILAILVPLSFNISFTISSHLLKNLAESFIEIALNNAVYKFEGEMTSLYAESSNSQTWYVSSPI